LGPVPGIAAVLSGTALDENLMPVAGVQVSISRLRISTMTASDGRFRFADIAPGQYQARFESPSYLPLTLDADLRRGDASLTAVLKSPELSEASAITVLAAPAATELFTAPSETSVLEGRRLEKKISPNVADMVSHEPGVNVITEAPGISKPVIRGLSGQNIVVAVDGIRNEVLQWGAEHAPEVDAFDAQKIEVIRGPQALLYGSDALGGVIEVSRAPLPDSAAGAPPLAGRLHAEVNANNAEIGSEAELYGASGAVGYKANVSQVNAGNYQSGQGIVQNSGFNQQSGDAILGVNEDWGTLSGEYALTNKSIEQPDLSPTTQYQYLQHQEGAIKAAVNSGFARYDISTTWSQERRREYNSYAQGSEGQPATLDWAESHYALYIKAHHRPLAGGLKGTWGLQLHHAVDNVSGVEQITPSFDENWGGAYAYEELPMFGDKLKLDAGAREDVAQYDIKATQVGISGVTFSNGNLTTLTPVAAQTLRYSATTGAAGFVLQPSKPWVMTANAGWGFRWPVPFELFANGIHEGTDHFEVGDSHLNPEQDLNTDLSFRYKGARFRGTAAVYDNQFQSFIYETPTGNVATYQGLQYPVFDYTQGNASIYGGEFDLSEDASSWLELKEGGDLVRAWDEQTSTWIPYTPADRLKLGWKAHAGSWGALRSPYFSFDADLYRRQALTADFEVPTPAYSLFNVETGFELPVAMGGLSFDVGVDNLLNKSYYDNLSLLKPIVEIQNGVSSVTPPIALDPGRAVYGKLTLPFGLIKKGTPD
jgi:iron complex outermembrane receptor protein